MFILILIFHSELQSLISPLPILELHSVRSHNLHLFVFLVKLHIPLHCLLLHVLPVSTLSHLVLSLL
jgi:hypothetical protein